MFNFYRKHLGWYKYYVFDIRERIASIVELEMKLFQIFILTIYRTTQGTVKLWLADIWIYICKNLVLSQIHMEQSENYISKLIPK